MLGLTGGYCAGKSEIAAILSGLGWTCVDVDAMGHRALEYSLPEVVKLLGPVARRPDGLPDRKAIGQLVFADTALMEQYEALVHPVMFALTDKAIAAAGGEQDGKICLDAAILYRLPQADRCRAILEVRAPLLARLQRGRARDGLGLLRILQRILSQHDLKQAGKAYASRIIIVKNAGDRQALIRTIQNLANQGFSGQADLLASGMLN
jgi:dephospho-CoA kinase